MPVVKAPPEQQPTYPLVFPTMPLAQQYCQGRGIEIGPSAHNLFGLENCLMVGLPIDMDPISVEEQIRLCGEYIVPDIEAFADALPFEDGELDYVIHSHVLEHLPNPIRALIEWHRVLRDGGILFMIVPHRDALEYDAKRPVTTLAELESAYERNLTHEDFVGAPEGQFGHHWVFTLDTVLELLDHMGSNGVTFHVERTEGVDSKVGNGFTVVARKVGPPPSPETSQQSSQTRKRKARSETPSE